MSDPTLSHPAADTTFAPGPARSSRTFDIIGGLTTFVTMAYIVIVNPAILATTGTGIPFSGAATATVLVAASMTLLMGL
jgi:AGZA family xanthine/uracil permease-like MFS transporter